jgi:hypothetical protein
MTFKRRLSELGISEVATAHLSGDPKSYTSDFILYSTLIGIKQEMNHSKCYTNSQKFLPLLSGFAILDQIGNCYRNKRLPAFNNPKSSGILKSLYYFCGFGMGDDDSLALYQFRNGMMHGASLASQDRKGNYHIFRYTDDRRQIVSRAPEGWDGTETGLNKDVFNWINVSLFCQMINKAIINATELLQSGDLDFLISKEELLHKYMMWLPEPS